MTTRIRDGREVHLRHDLLAVKLTANGAVPPSDRECRQMLAALIDAEEMLVDYQQSAGQEAPRDLNATISKVRDAIRAAEDPERKVSVRVG